jgi:hypothetical protein
LFKNRFILLSSESQLCGHSWSCIVALVQEGSRQGTGLMFSDIVTSPEKQSCTLAHSLPSEKSGESPVHAAFLSGAQFLPWGGLDGSGYTQSFSTGAAS